MAKATFLKTVRKFYHTLSDGTSSFVNPEHVNGVPKGEYTCPVCGIPMFVAEGQIMACHGWCKKDYKAMLRNMHKHEQRRAKKE